MAFDYFQAVEGRQPSMQCVFESSVRQNVPANVLLSILQIEGGKLGTVRVNQNGSLDLGPAQINTVHLQELKSLGVDVGRVSFYLKYDGCYSIEFAAFLLKRRLSEPIAALDFWTAAANYHSKTPKYNFVYRSRLKPLSEKWGAYLSRNYLTKEYQK